MAGLYIGLSRIISCNLHELWYNEFKESIFFDKVKPEFCLNSDGGGNGEP